MEGAAEWPATGLENQGERYAQGFDSSTFLCRLDSKRGDDNGAYSI
jgi:hypothetical protein